ncbi:trimeric intracellular cation channel family protein [Eggerthellaceae bacterium zg-887]|uniref:trimeric intracellular cation channel family protein n=1 Tax=Xiamenia xianingshaonis TaxID=2682776 RepID=UPI00140A634A|nr:TRIC cation channel family protein [Xiamenia xianingshaonis]NHM15336.1 trimeric intracellular cation channel family protein [Xiamenia xianingshaonis]
MDAAPLIDSLFSDGRMLEIPWSIDYFSVLVGVLTGALFACDRRLDIVGTVASGLLTAYGGGITRDLLMQNHGVYFTSDPNLILICVALCFFVFYFRGLFRHLEATVFFADALSVGLFALAGASKAFECGYGVVMTVIFGAITSVGGGALRDMSVGETPGIFQSSNFYAVAGLGGSAAFTLLAFLQAPLVIAGIVCVFVVFSLRYWSVYFDWKTTSDPALSQHLRSGAGKMGRSLKSVGQRALRFASSAVAVFLHAGGTEKAMKARRPKLSWRQRKGRGWSQAGRPEREAPSEEAPKPPDGGHEEPT